LRRNGNLAKQKTAYNMAFATFDWCCNVVTNFIIGIHFCRLEHSVIVILVEVGPYALGVASTTIVSSSGGKAAKCIIQKTTHELDHKNLVGRAQTTKTLHPRKMRQ
jgi:hypothetical protein